MPTRWRQRLICGIDGTICSHLNKDNTMGSTQSLFTNVDIMTTISLCFPRINTTLILENNKVCPKITTTIRHWRFKKRKEKKNEKNIYIIFINTLLAYTQINIPAIKTTRKVTIVAISNLTMML